MLAWEARLFHTDADRIQFLLETDAELSAFLALGIYPLRLATSGRNTSPTTSARSRS